MRLVLTGRSRYAGMVEKLLTESACEVEWREPQEIPDTEDSQPVVYLPGNRVDAFLTDDEYAERILTEKIKKLKKADILVLFLLDRDREASSDLIRLVLLRAKALRERKRPLPVLVAASSMRCGVGELESLYRETRKSGVVFLKYDAVSVSGSDGCSAVVLEEGGNRYELEAPVLINCEDCPEADTDVFAKKMRLRPGEGKKYSGAKWFLPAGFTARRNVWVLEDDVLYRDSRTALNGILQEAAKLSERSQLLAAKVDDSKCAFCYTCYRVCPHAAPKPDGENHAMQVDPELCAGCGMCRAVCPAGAIELEDIAGAPQPEDCHKKGKLLAFCCENSAALAAQTAFDGLPAEKIEISCGGDVNERRILQALKSYDRVLVAVCAKDACRHFDGNTRCELQAERAKKTLASLGMDPGRVAVVKASFAAAGEIREAAEALDEAEKVRETKEALDEAEEVREAAESPAEVEKVRETAGAAAVCGEEEKG